MRVAYGCVLLAAELLREEASSAIAGLDLDDSQSAAPPTPRGGLAPWMVRKVSTHLEAHLDSAISSPDLAGVVQPGEPLAAFGQVSLNPRTNMRVDRERPAHKPRHRA